MHMWAHTLSICKTVNVKTAFTFSSYILGLFYTHANYFFFYTSCILYLYYYYINSTSDCQALDPEGWELPG